MTDRFRTHVEVSVIALPKSHDCSTLLFGVKVWTLLFGVKVSTLLFGVKVSTLLFGVKSKLWNHKAHNSPWDIYKYEDVSL